MTEASQPKPAKPLWPSSLPFVGAVEEHEKKRLKTLTAQAIAIVENSPTPAVSSELPEVLNEIWAIVSLWVEKL